MSASGSADGGDTDTRLTASAQNEPPVRRHGTRLQRCLSETGERRIVVYQPCDGCWMDVARDDVRELSEMR
ncbi:MAG: hypothetical protein U5J64_03845 [Halobacteriales archaeon]|nr:hypothetical protein [Halobacteriales archaeon]